MILLAIALSVIFMLLSLLHFTWAGGSLWGFNASLPQKENGDILFLPKKRDSLFVALGLLLFGIFYLSYGGIIGFALPGWSSTAISWLIPSLFLLRSVGDRRYVGFFKRVNSTAFAQRDTRFFSPLCLVIAVLGWLIMSLK